MSVLEVFDIRKGFRPSLLGKRQEVLNGISFRIPPSSITGFLGANGAGKTTTMKCILGLIFPDSGEFKYFGEKKFNSSIKKRIGFLPERPYFYSYLTGREFLQFYGEISLRISRSALRDRIEELLRRVDLVHAGDKALRDYSKGMLQKIGLAQALIHEPELLILDEPMSGLDPDGRYYLSELIRETAREGRAVFLSSHLLHDTEQLCENLVILKNGKVFFEGATRHLLERLQSQYKIDYIEKNQRHTSQLESLNAVQDKIKELQQRGCIIEKVDQDRVTLEEFFVKDVLRKKT